MKRIQWSLSCVVPCFNMSGIMNSSPVRLKKASNGTIEVGSSGGDFALRSGGTHYQKTSYQTHQNIDFLAKETVVFRQLKIFSCRIPGLGGWVWISLTWFLLVRLWGRPKKPKKPKLPTKTHKNRRTKSCFVRSSETRSVTRSWKLWRSGYQHRIISFFFLFFSCFMFCIFFSLDSGSSKKTFQRVEMTPLNFALWHFMMCLDPPVPGMLPQLDERRQEMPSSSQIIGRDRDLIFTILFCGHFLKESLFYTNPQRPQQCIWKHLWFLTRTASTSRSQDIPLEQPWQLPLGFVDSWVVWTGIVIDKSM